MKTFTDIPAFLQETKAAFPEYDFDLCWQGRDNATGERWARAFIAYAGCQIGRINFQPIDIGVWKVYGFKHYKPSEYDYIPEDAIFYALPAWVRIGFAIDVNALVPIAKANREKKIEEIKAWRAANYPTKKRAGYSRSWNGELRKLVHQIEENMAEALDA